MTFLLDSVSLKKGVNRVCRDESSRAELDAPKLTIADELVDGGAAQSQRQRHFVYLVSFAVQNLLPCLLFRAMCRQAFTRAIADLRVI